MPSMMLTISLSEAIELTLLVIVGALYASYIIPEKIKQHRCKHPTYREDGFSCDAYCTKCGKDLGFIGKLREDKTKQEQ